MRNTTIFRKMENVVDTVKTFEVKVRDFSLFLERFVAGLVGGCLPRLDVAVGQSKVAFAIVVRYLKGEM